MQVVRPTVGERICDAACGSAGFLCESFDYLRANKSLTTSDLKTPRDRTFYGKEKKLSAYEYEIGGVVAAGLIADRFGRCNTLGSLAILIALFSFVAPWLLGSSSLGGRGFNLVCFGLLGLSYGQAARAVTAHFEARYRYTSAALTSDLAWLIGAAFAPLVALSLSASFWLGFMGTYLFSGAVCTLVALRINKVRENRG